MSLQGVKIGVGCSTSSSCPDAFGCGTDCPDFTIKRHDTKPPFKISVEDCDGPLDLTGDRLVAEVSMWATGKLKTAITADATYFGLADKIGFEQIMVGDIIVMSRARLPEYMLVTGFDETNYLVQVQRGYNSTTPSAWKKGQPLRIFRAMNAPAEVESRYEDILQTDGTTAKDQLVDSLLVFEWDANSTCLPGCYWLEFKLLQMTEEAMSALSVSSTPSFTPSNLTPTDFGCTLGAGVEWVRRFPSTGEGFLIKIVDSPTMELA